MKYLLILCAFLYSGIALANNDIKPLGNQCQIVFVIDEIGYFDQKWKADQFCQQVQSGHGFNNRCFVRQLDRNFWEGNFTHRGVFTGDKFDSIFDQYQRYIWDNDIFQRDSFNHRARIFNCLRDPY